MSLVVGTVCDVEMINEMPFLIGEAFLFRKILKNLDEA